jgi:hypothetical protein
MITVDQDEINKINMAYDSGKLIFLYTGRGWDYYEVTKNQLSQYGVKHHELIMGKPLGTYVDKEVRRTL